MHRRENERAILKRKLLADINIQMPAPRRIGKTWTIKRLAEDLRSDNWLIVEVDVQGIGTIDKFARTLCQKIQEQISFSSGLKAALKKRFDNLYGGDWGDNPLNAVGKVDPIDFLEALLAPLGEGQCRSAIFVDEIAYFVLSMAKEDSDSTREFFYRLRNLQNSFSRVRWLYTGSIGLDVVAERFGISGAFVDLETFVLEPFTTEEARSFMRDQELQGTLRYPFHAHDEDLERLFSELGWLSPYYLELVANEVRPSSDEVDGVLRATAQDFDDAIEAVLHPSRKSKFSVWTEHVDKNLPRPQRDLARQLLDKLSKSPDGETLDTLLSVVAKIPRRAVRDVMIVLESDGLVLRVSNRYKFRSGLVRRYWLEYEAE